MEKTRPTKANNVLLAIGMVIAIVAAVFYAPEANWDFALFGLLIALAVFGELTGIQTESKLKISGSFLAIVLAIVFLGGTPAAAIGTVSILIGWLAQPYGARNVFFNLFTYLVFPLVVGVAFHLAVTNWG